jgi:predicted CoA-binding protein
MTDEELKRLLAGTRTIAVVGHSNKPWRDSYRIGFYLRAEGYQVYPVNPNITAVLDQPAYPSLAAVPGPIDLVDVFRAPQHVGDVVSQALAVRARAVWTQLGVTIQAGDRDRLARAGIAVVENRCIKVEHRRLLKPPGPTTCPRAPQG